MVLTTYVFCQYMIVVYPIIKRSTIHQVIESISQHFIQSTGAIWAALCNSQHRIAKEDLQKSHLYILTSTVRRKEIK